MLDISQPDPWSAERQNAASQQSGSALPILVEYWNIVLKRKWLIMAIFVVCLAASLVITMLMTREYEAVSRIEISRTQKQITEVQGVESESAGSELEFYQTQYSLLEARSVAERIVRSLKLDENPLFFEAHGELMEDESVFGVAELKQSPESTTEKRFRRAVSLLREHSIVAPIRNSSLIDIRYQSYSPSISTMVVNEWAKQFIQASIDRRFASTADARSFLEGRLTDLRERVERSERDLTIYANAKDIVNLQTTVGDDGRTRVQSTLVSENLTALNALLSRATAERITAESRLNTNGSADEINNSAFTAMRQKRAELEASYSRLMETFDPSYPPAKGIQSEIDSINKSISQEEARLARSVRDGFREAYRAEAALKKRVNDLKSALLRQREDTIQYNIYQREADTNRELYDALLQRYKEIGVAGVGASNVAIIDVAEIPKAPSSPNLILNVIIAFLIGGILSGTAVLILEQFDEGIKAPKELQSKLNIALLGATPETTALEAHMDINDPKSDLSESYLTVSSNLAFSTDHGVPKSLLVTSTKPGEGKSTTAFALATILARTGRNVVLIDADMRSPSLHQFVSGKNHLGVSNFLSGGEIEGWITVENGKNHFALIPAGPKPPNAGELLSGDRISLLVDQLKSQYDHVVIDGPPVLGLADALLLAKAVEGVVFIVKADELSARQINTSLDRIRNMGCKIFGGILTGVKSKTIEYGYGYGYGYGHSHEDDLDQEKI